MLWRGWASDPDDYDYEPDEETEGHIISSCKTFKKGLTECLHLGSCKEVGDAIRAAILQANSYMHSIVGSRRYYQVATLKSQQLAIYSVSTVGLMTAIRFDLVVFTATLVPHTTNNNKELDSLQFQTRKPKQRVKLRETKSVKHLGSL